MACSGCFSPGKKTQYPLYRRPDGPHSQSGWVHKNLAPTGVQTQTIQAIASCYTNYGIPVTTCTLYIQPSNHTDLNFIIVMNVQEECCKMFAILPNHTMSSGWRGVGGTEGIFGRQICMF